MESHQRAEAASASAMQHLRRLIPPGRLLPDDVWAARHRIVLAVLWAHVPAVTLFALVVGESPRSALLESAVVAAAAGVASSGIFGRTIRSVAASFGLLSASAIFVYLSGGYIELHFHFFVMVALMAIYQEWVPFLMAIAYVVFHHGVLGVLAPEHVFNHHAGHENPLFWAAVHGGFILALSVVCLLSWSYAQRALVDPLTGHANRTLFIERLSQALRRRTPTRVGILYLDLDDFKHVNDSLGHAMGDELLASVARRINACVRRTDTVARLGGDEFGILLPFADVERATDVAHRVLDALGAPFTVMGKEIYQRATIGIAFSGTAATDAETLLRDADMAMYDAKAAGKGRMGFFRPELHVVHLKRLEFESELRHAIEANELVLHYQPIVDLGAGRVSDLEALVRWRHPIRGLLQPGEFIPLAEETGQVVGLGRWVLGEACRQLREWQRLEAWPDRVGVSVNVSIRQLRSTTFVDELAQVLRDSGVDASQLTLELTETTLLTDGEVATERLVEARQLGVRIAIDDFGAGYSSLSYLQRLPIDVLKIDRAFVLTLDAGSAGSAVMQAALALGNRMGIATVAEGVETADQLLRLQRMGCRLVQGFYFARPMHPDDVASYVRTLRTVPSPLFGRPQAELLGRPAHAVEPRAQAGRPVKARARPQPG